MTANQIAERDAAEDSILHPDTTPETAHLPKGFVQWANEAKDAFYWTDGKNVFRSPIHNAADVTTGYTLGRWESSVEHWNHYALAFGRARIAV